MENNQREITHKILKPELWFLCMTHRLIMLNKCTKFYWKILNGFQVIQRTRNCIENNQREITPKILKPELWFLCMTHRLIVVYKCTKFHWKIFNGFQVIQRTRNCIENNQREITPKILKLELWFLCMTHRLVVVYKCTKFHWKIFNGFQVIEQTRFVTDRQTDRQTDGQTDRRTGKNNYVSRPCRGET